MSGVYLFGVIGWLSICCKLPVIECLSLDRILSVNDNFFLYLLKQDFRMLHVVTTGAYYPPVVTTWKILTTGPVVQEHPS